MSGQKAKPLPQLPISISPPELWKLEFERKDSDESAAELPTEIPLATGLSVARFGTDEIGVELSVALRELPTFSAEVSYRARFQVRKTEDIDDLEVALKTIATRIAPATLYPFVREAIASAAARAGLQMPVLPVLNFAAMFSASEVELPPVTPERA